MHVFHFLVVMLCFRVALLFFFCFVLFCFLFFLKVYTYVGFYAHCSIYNCCVWETISVAREFVPSRVVLRECGHVCVWRVQLNGLFVGFFS